MRCSTLIEAGVYRENSRPSIEGSAPPMVGSYLQVSSNEDGDWLHGAGRRDRSGRTADALPWGAGRPYSFQALFHKCCCFTASGPFSESRAEFCSLLSRRPSQRHLPESRNGFRKISVRKALKVLLLALLLVQLGPMRVRERGDDR